MSDARQAAATAMLARHGLAPAAVAAAEPTEQTLATLRALVTGPEGPAVADALAAFPEPPVAALLLALEPHADRATHKAIRRALYRLRQQHVALPEVAPPPSAPRAQTPDVEGLISAVMGDGERVVWLTRVLPQGGTLVVYAHLHEPHGLLELSVGEMGRKQLRALRQQMAAERMRLVAVDWRVADALVVEAQRRLATPDRARDYLRLRPRLTTEAPAPPAEPVSTRVGGPEGAVERAALVATSATLLEEPEVQTWWPGAAAARPVVEEIATVRDSPLLVSRVAQEERLREVIRRAAATMIPPAVLVRRLAGTAYVFAETARPESARRALAVAATLDDHPDQAADVPLVVALTERALGPLLKQETTRQEEGSLLVTPGQFLRDRSSARPGPSRG